MSEEIQYIDLYLHGTILHDNIISQPLELFIQEIELGMQISPNEIWGIQDSVNLSRYLFNQYVTVTQIRNEITNYISKNCFHASYFQYNITVETLKNSGNTDLIYIVFNINSEDQDGINQTYVQ
jgi:hypothetical protein